MNAADFLLPGLRATARSGDFAMMERLGALLTVEPPRDMAQVEQMKLSVGTEIACGQVERLTHEMGEGAAVLFWLRGFALGAEQFTDAERWEIIAAVLAHLDVPRPFPSPGV